MSGHAHAAPSSRRRLAAALALTVTVLLAELVTSLVTGSLALLADAGHLTVDAMAVLLSLVAVTLAGRPATARRTFGLARLEVLGAAGSAVLLLVVGTLVAVGAVRHLLDPPDVQALPVLVVGTLGLLANGTALLVLRGDGAGHPQEHPGHGRQHHQRHGLAVRSAMLEVGSDLLGSAAVVVAAAVLLTTGEQRADAVASLVVAALVLPRAVVLLREVAAVLLESTPPGLDLEAVRHHLEEAPGVLAVHDLHAWAITSGHPLLSAHVVVADDVLATGRAPGLLDHLQACLTDHFALEHVTLQLEPAGHADHEAALHL